MALFWRSDVALALFGVAGLAAFGWIVLWAQALNSAVAALSTRVDAAVSAGQRGPTRSGQKAAQRSLDALRMPLLRAAADAREAMILVQKVPSDTVELGRLYTTMVNHDRPMPALGNWAMTPGSVVWVINHINTAGVRTIVECGSGSSTVWFATAMEHRGGEGRIVSLESDADYAQMTRNQLAELGLSHRAEVIHAPLVETALPGRAVQPWYDISGLPDDVTAIDLLFVDGPVGALAKEIRYPGFPELAERLAPGATVILDDTGRPDERHIVETWLQERPAGRQLAVTHQLDRSTVFVVKPT